MRKIQNNRCADDFLEPKFTDAARALDYMQRRVDVGAGMRIEGYPTALKSAGGREIDHLYSPPALHGRRQRGILINGDAEINNTWHLTPIRPELSWLRWRSPGRLAPRRWIPPA